MKVLNYSITYIDGKQPKEELIILKIHAIQRYIELLADNKFKHIDTGSLSDISALKIWKITNTKSIDITGAVNKFLAK